MTLYAFPMDRTGCGFYRMIWPLRALRHRLPSVIVYPGDDVPVRANLSHTKELLGVQAPDDCSAVLMQRPTSELLVECIPHFQARGIRVLVDVDDDMLALSTRHPAFTELRKREGHSAQAILRACQLADLVITSTPSLLSRYAPPGRGVLLRNRLRSDWRACLQAGRPEGRGAPPTAAPRVSAPYQDVNSDALKVGWPGSISIHPDDLNVLGKALPRLPDEPAWRFVICGPEPRPGFRLKQVVGVDGSFTGAVPFADWLPHISASLDIGVAPLEQIPFNRAKSWLKPLELAASGVPFACTNTPEYVALGAGLISEGGKGFRRNLQALLASPALRAEEVQRNHEIADANTYERHQEEWFEALAPFTDTSPATTEEPLAAVTG